jgi:hypothetical protein
MNSNEFESISAQLEKSIAEALYNECPPYPPAKVYVHRHTLLPEKSPGWARAKVTYVVYCPGEKTHSVNIRFQHDKTGRFIRNSMQYV